MNRKTFILTAIAATLGTGLLYTSAQAYGLGFGSGNGEQMVQSLSQKLGKSEAEIQTAFDDIREEHHQQMLSSFEERLSTAVAAGELTEAQKQLIIDKHAQLQAEHQAQFDNRENMAPEEWRQLREAQRQELEQWAQDEGIDVEYLFGGYGRGQGGMMGRGGFGRHMGFNANTTTQ